VNNYGFYVQRRGDSTSAWTDLPGAFLPGHGTTTEPNVYLYDDRQAGPGSWQYRLRQVDNDGTAHFSEAIAVNLVTSVEQANIPTAFALDQNFPNPFNPSAVIRYAVAGARGQGLGTSHVRLVVYDLLGREVAVLVDENKAPGNYEVTFSAANLASGVYFCRLVAGEFVAVRKMTLAR
jgi:hypothetical protein